MSLREGLLCRLQVSQPNRELLNLGEQGATELANMQYKSGNRKSSEGLALTPDKLRQDGQLLNVRHNAV